MNISDYLRTSLLNHSLGVVAFTMPTTVWAALYSSPPPTSAGGGTEVTAADYARVSTTWDTAAVGVISNATPIRFPSTGTTLSNWGTVLGVGLFASPTGGNLLFYGPLSAAVTLSAGSDFQLAASTLSITIS